MLTILYVGDKFRNKELCPRIFWVLLQISW